MPGTFRNYNQRLHSPQHHEENRNGRKISIWCENCTEDTYSLRNRQIFKKTAVYQKQHRHHRETPVNVTTLPRGIFRNIALTDAYATYETIEEHVTNHLDKLAVSDPSWTITHFDYYWPNHTNLKQYWGQQLQLVKQLQAIIWPDAWHKSTQFYLNSNRQLGEYRFPAGWWYHPDSRIHFPPQIEVDNVLANGTVILPGHEYFDPRDIRVEWFDYNIAEEERRNNRSACIWCGANQKEHELEHCASQIPYQIAAGWTFDLVRRVLHNPDRFGRKPTPASTDTLGGGRTHGETSRSAEKRRFSGSEDRTNETLTSPAFQREDYFSWKGSNYATYGSTTEPAINENIGSNERDTGNQRGESSTLGPVEIHKEVGSEKEVANENDQEKGLNAWEDSSWVHIGETHISETHIKVNNTLTVIPINNRKPGNTSAQEGFETKGKIDANTLRIESWFWSDKDNREYPLPKWNPETEGPLSLELKRTFEGKVWIKIDNPDEIENAINTGDKNIKRDLTEKALYV